MEGKKGRRGMVRRYCGGKNRSTIWPLVRSVGGITEIFLLPSNGEMESSHTRTDASVQTTEQMKTMLSTQGTGTTRRTTRLPDTQEVLKLLVSIISDLLIQRATNELPWKISD